MYTLGVFGVSHVDTAHCADIKEMAGKTVVGYMRLCRSISSFV